MLYIKEEEGQGGQSIHTKSQFYDSRARMASPGKGRKKRQGWCSRNPETKVLPGDFWEKKEETKRKKKGKQLSLPYASLGGNRMEQEEKGHRGKKKRLNPDIAYSKEDVSQPK